MEVMVKWFNNEKGYGFIEFKNTEIFVCYSLFEQEKFKILNKGDKVEFNLLKNDDKYQLNSVILNSKRKIKNIKIKEKIELITALTTITNTVFGFLDNKNSEITNFNIDCKNCEIQIIEQINSNTSVNENIIRKK